MLLLGQRPLSASDADRQLFANRNAELQRVCRALDLGLNAYVHGPPGSGRTSFLRQIERQVSGAKYVRLQGVQTLDERLEQFECAITGSNALPRERGNPLAEALGSFASTQYKVVVDPLRHVRSALTSHPAPAGHLLLVDDLDKDGCHEVFGKLRDDLWELPIQWVVSGSSSRLEPPADTFFDAVIELEPFDLDGLQELVERRAASGTGAEGLLLRSRAEPAIESIAPSTPRRALSVIRELYLSEDLESATHRLAAQSAARARLSATAARVLDAFVHHGPTHAGNEQLLEEVGVSRSRVVQVLAQLEAEGLVTAQRAGRRKLYAATKGGYSVRKPLEAATASRLI